MRPLTLIARGAFVFACGLTLVAALTPPEAHPLQILPWEKANHLLAFYVLSLLAAAAAPRAPLLAIGALLVGVGAGIELLQGLPIVHRDPAILDVGIDFVAIAGALTPIALGRWRHAQATAPRVVPRRRTATLDVAGREPEAPPATVPASAGN